MEGIFHFQRSKDEEFYNILGCDELSSTEQIIAEYKAQVLNCHPDKHPNDPDAAKRFGMLQRAKEVLSNPELRKKYDQWHGSGIAMSFQKWLGLRDSAHQSMHWAYPKKECMIEQGDSAVDNPPPSAAWQSTLQSSQDRSNLQEDTSNRNQLYFNIETQPRQAPSIWKRDPPSDMLKKFRNYEI
ncbi:hypothetical protein ACJMK2_034527 [Sinanodonta woodiana]|uniref:J domain-containing protein n=1 Tax=Sinanodonta woodiana TaxID=1069815 RepID=A0ABD3WRW4_SINWO